MLNNEDVIKIEMQDDSSNFNGEEISFDFNVDPKIDASNKNSIIVIPENYISDVIIEEIFVESQSSLTASENLSGQNDHTNLANLNLQAENNGENNKDSPEIVENKEMLNNSSFIATKNSFVQNNTVHLSSSNSQEENKIENKIDSPEITEKKTIYNSCFNSNKNLSFHYEDPLIPLREINNQVEFNSKCELPIDLTYKESNPTGETQTSTIINNGLTFYNLFTLIN